MVGRSTGEKAVPLGKRDEVIDLVSDDEEEKEESLVVRKKPASAARERVSCGLGGRRGGGGAGVLVKNPGRGVIDDSDESSDELEKFVGLAVLSQRYRGEEAKTAGETSGEKTGR